MPSSEDRPKRNRNRITQGRAFENRAAEFYVAQGFAVLERNWQASHKEIDLIVRRDALIVFVEVKAGFSKEFGHPADRVDSRKRRLLTAAAETYIAERGITGCDFRFDVVTFAGGKLEHFPDAFAAEG
jgi:putative endonuclease